MPKQFFIILALVLALGACANTSQVLSTKQYSSQHSDKWVLHAQTAEPEHRELWESSCVKAWHNAGLSAEPAFKHWQSQEVQSSTLEQAQAAGFTQVLVLDTRALLLPQAKSAHPVGNTFEKEFNGGERHTIKTYRDQVDDSQPQQRISVDIYPLATHNKPQRLAVDSHEANQLHKIARSQCKALAEFIQAGQH